MADLLPIECGDCGAHYQLDPGGSVQDATCEACGGKRFLRMQPNPVHSDGDLRNMVDMQAGGIDRGGSPNTEGVFASVLDGLCPICQAPEGECPHTTFDNHNNMLGVDTRAFLKGTPGNPLDQGTIMGEDGERPVGKRDNYMHSKRLAHNSCPYCSMPLSPQEEANGSCPYCSQPLPPKPRVALNVPFNNVNYLRTDIPADMTMDEYRQQPRAPVCPLCDNYIDDPRGFNYHVMQYHPEFAMAQNTPPTVAKSIEMRTLNMEPYAPLWDESYIPSKEAGFAAPLAEGAGALLGDTGIGSAIGGFAKKMLPFGIGSMMRGVFGGGGGQNAGGEAPQQPDPAVPIQQLGHAHIPFLLMADLETPDSVKSVDEQHDDPEEQDQKEFNDGDKSPNNLAKPGLEDSGANGEDNVRSDSSAQTGFSENSPGIERALMILPLLLHYFESPESGEQDPLIKGLHEALEQESPGYMDNEHPDGPKIVEMIMQHHKSPHGVHAGVNAFPSGLPAQPGVAMDTPQQMGAQGTCQTCGAQLAGDGSCPNCGAAPKNQMGAPQQQQDPMAAQNSSLPLSPQTPRSTFTGNNQGPVNPEQIKAMVDAMKQRGMQNMIPDMLQDPSSWGWLLNDIQNSPNTPPLVDPSQAMQNQPPQPMGDPSQMGMQGAPGAMPVMDPSQPGGGGGQPMMPMSHRQAADTVAPRCPKCNSGTTETRQSTGDDGMSFRCHACGNIWDDGADQLDMNKYKGAGLNIYLADLPNPVLNTDKGADDRNNTLVWKDSQGQQIEPGQQYQLYTAGINEPDEVEVVSRKPDNLELKLVGSIQGLYGGMAYHPINIKPEDMGRKYTFVPAITAQDQPEPQNMGGMPGLDHIPQSAPTTDETSNTYPNAGTMSHVADLEEEPEMEDICHRCGNTWVEHTASSSTTTMHECARCGNVWETRDNSQGREAGEHLAWIMHDSAQDDTFWGEMERAKAMRTSGGQSRNLAQAVAKDERYQRIHDILETNRQSKTAGRRFTPSEQRELIMERGSARNADLLDLEGTHYVTHWDPKANGLNAPDAHLILGM